MMPATPYKPIPRNSEIRIAKQAAGMIPALGEGGPVVWGEITGPLGDQADLADSLSGKASASHGHAPSDVSGTAIIDGDTRLTDARTPVSHPHTEADVTGLVSDLAGKAAASHGHAESDVTNLVSDLAGKAAAAHDHDSDYAALGHGHAQLHDRQHSITDLADHSFPGGTTFLRADGEFAAPGGGSDPWTVVKLANDFTVNVTANTNVTGLLFTPAAGKTYIVYGAFLLGTGTATVGARPGIAWPTVADGGARVDAPNSLTTAAMRIWGARTTQNAASTGLADTTNSHYAKLEALIVAGASPSGNFLVTLASETAGTTVTMKAGSYLMYREI